MKRTRFVAIGILLFLASILQGQVSVNVNLGSPPPWGPAGVTPVRYYYLPDVQAYYDVPAARFIYYNGGVWVHRAALPERYRTYDLYSGYKVVMTDYHGSTPYTNFNQHKIKYAKGYRGQPQKTIGPHPGTLKGVSNSPSKNSQKGKSGQGHGGGNHGKKK